MINCNKHKEGVCISGSKRTNLKYVAYANDVAFILFNVHAINRMPHGFREYERAPGLCLNMRKLNAMIVNNSTF